MPVASSHGHPEKFTLKLFRLMFLPSAMSAMLCVLIGLLLIGGIIGKKLYASNPLTAYNQSQDSGQVPSDVQPLPQTNTYAGSKFLEDLPVALFWAFIGLLVYYLVNDIRNTFSKAQQLQQEMNYINVERAATLNTVFARAGLRVVALISWWIYAIFFFKVVVPFCLHSAHIAAGDFLTVGGLSYACLAVVLMAVGLHAHLVLARMTALRPRLFASDIYL